MLIIILSKTFDADQISETSARRVAAPRAAKMSLKSWLIVSAETGMMEVTTSRRVALTTFCSKKKGGLVTILSAILEK